MSIGTTLKRPQVLFIDDEAAVLDGIRRSLMQHDTGWDAIYHTDSVRALGDPAVLTADVVVTDLRMPGMGGIDLMKALRAKGMRAEVIILTGAADMTSALAAINEVNAFRFYLKPCDRRRLTEGIADAINHRRAQRATADLLPFALLALDAAGRVTFMNSEGGRLASGGDVFVLDGQGRCRAGTPAETAKLMQAVDGVVQGGEATAFALTGAVTGIRYAVLAEPAAGANGAAVQLFVLDPAKRHPPPIDALKRLFDLSNSEARLAHGLAQGMDIREAAEGMDVTVQTARTYLKSLFEKTGTNRQADLVRTLITTMPHVGT